MEGTIPAPCEDGKVWTPQPSGRGKLTYFKGGCVFVSGEKAQMPWFHLLEGRDSDVAKARTWG